MLPDGPSVIVNRADLRDALKYLKPYSKSKKPGRAAIVLDSGVLILQSGPVSARMRAEGQWIGTARFAPIVFVALHEGLPEADQIAISVNGDRLRVAGFTFPCSWDDLREPPISLPLNASVNLILSYRLLYTEAELTRAGLIAELRNAETRRDKALAAAAQALEPLEITRRDLIEYHELRIRQLYLRAADGEDGHQNNS